MSGLCTPLSGWVCHARRPLWESPNVRPSRLTMQHVASQAQTGDLCSQQLLVAAGTRCLQHMLCNLSPSICCSRFQNQGMVLVIRGAAWQLASQVRLPEGLHVGGREGRGYCRWPCVDAQHLAVRRPKAGLHGFQHLL